MAASALIEPVETEGSGGGGVVAAAFGDVQVAGVFEGRGDGGADGGRVGGAADERRQIPLAGPARRAYIGGMKVSCLRAAERAICSPVAAA
jgi:hypothetical protein